MVRLELTTLFLENNILPIKLHPPVVLQKKNSAGFKTFYTNVQYKFHSEYNIYEHTITVK
jgi:hypothetical protein